MHYYISPSIALNNGAGNIEKGRECKEWYVLPFILREIDKFMHYYYCNTVSIITLLRLI